MTKQDILQYRYVWCRQYAASLENKKLVLVWMALDSCESPTFQGIPMGDWEQIVWDELVSRGIFQNAPSLWERPIQAVSSFITTMKKEQRKRQRKHVLKVIEKKRGA